MTEPPRKDETELQFDRVDGGAAPTSEPAVNCAVCKRTLTREYYSANGAPICEECKDAALNSQAAALQKRRFPKAFGWGLLGAIGGAIIYYAVIAIADLEIGIIAILCGYMVGWGVRRGAGGHGGRRYQLLAAALTYFSVGLAYTPLAFKGATQGTGADSTATAPRVNAKDSAAIAISQARRRQASDTDAVSLDSVMNNLSDTTTTAAAVTADSSVATGRDEGTMSPIAAIGALLLIVWTLPVLAIVGSMPSGLISALIIFIGMRQAWQMAAATPLDIQGPFKVGSGVAPASA